MPDCRLYLITPPEFDPAAFAPSLEAALAAGDVAALQLRLKPADETAIRDASAILQPICARAGVAFVLNDRADLARAVGADGVHVGATDGDAATARRLVGPDLQLGVSCYDSRDLALRAGEASADYVAFGAFFPSPTKDTEIRADLELLSWWSEMMELPVVAIGGITPANCAPLVRAGADFLAVISAVWSHADGPAAGVRAMNEAIATA